MHENPWVLITYNEILLIQEGLKHLEREVPENNEQLGKIIRIVRTVQERQPCP
jgi:hypothetical protein